MFIVILQSQVAEIIATFHCFICLFLLSNYAGYLSSEMVSIFVYPVIFSLLLMAAESLRQSWSSLAEIAKAHHAIRTYEAVGNGRFKNFIFRSAESDNVYVFEFLFYFRLPSYILAEIAKARHAIRTYGAVGNGRFKNFIFRSAESDNVYVFEFLFYFRLPSYILAEIAKARHAIRTYDAVGNGRFKNFIFRSAESDNVYVFEFLFYFRLPSYELWIQCNVSASRRMTNLGPICVCLIKPTFDLFLIVWLSLLIVGAMFLKQFPGMSRCWDLSLVRSHIVCPTSHSKEWILSTKMTFNMQYSLLPVLYYDAWLAPPQKLETTPHFTERSFRDKKNWENSLQFVSDGNEKVSWSPTQRQLHWKHEWLRQLWYAYRRTYSSNFTDAMQHYFSLAPHNAIHWLSDEITPVSAAGA
jgi:hypothetical protein